MPRREHGLRRQRERISEDVSCLVTGDMLRQPLEPTRGAGSSDYDAYTDSCIHDSWNEKNPPMKVRLLKVSRSPGISHVAGPSALLFHVYGIFFNGGSAARPSWLERPRALACVFHFPSEMFNGLTVEVNFRLAHDSAVTASVLLSMVEDRYKQIRTYRDHGLLLARYEGEEKPDEIIFKTWFVRPAKFRFEWVWKTESAVASKMLNSSQVVLNNESGAFSFDSNTGQFQHEESFRLSIAAATGVSLGAVHTVISLLLPDLGGSGILGLQQPVLSDLILNGERQFRLTGRCSDGSIQELFIGAEDLLIRRLNDIDKIETRSDIQIDRPIPADVFMAIPNDS